jgi:hypothetical protein
MEDRQPDLRARLAPTAGSARLWRAVTGVFLAIGLLAAANIFWTVGTDLHARQFWPQASGELTSISEQSSVGVARASRRTRYWVQYVVRFVVPAGQCRTGVTEPGESGQTACIGTVRTRSTQSSSTAGAWMKESFHERAVKVRYDPDGSDIKIEGESVWLRYPWDSIGVVAIWLFTFGYGFTLARRRLLMLEAQHDPLGTARRDAHA